MSETKTFVVPDYCRNDNDDFIRILNPEIAEKEQRDQETKQLKEEISSLKEMFSSFMKQFKQ